MVIDFAQPFAAVGAFVFGFEEPDEAVVPGDPSSGKNASVLDTTAQCILHGLLVPIVGGGDG